MESQSGSRFGVHDGDVAFLLLWVLALTRKKILGVRETFGHNTLFMRWVSERMKDGL